MEPNEYIEIYSPEKRLVKKFDNKISVIVVIPSILRKVKGISFYKFVFDKNISSEYIEFVVSKVVNTSKFYIVDHHNNLLTKLSKCRIEEDDNVYLYIRLV